MPYADEELLESALRCKTKKQWRFGDPSRSLAAYRRGKEFYRKCTTHMRTTVNPDNLPYVIYVYEFADNHAYIGYTYEPPVRHKTHTHMGRVYRYIQKCPQYQYKLLADGIPTLIEACDAEIYWHDKYKAAGWKMINIAKCGVPSGAARRIYTHESILADALKYDNVTAWGKSDRGQFARAQKLGQEFMDKCVAHMSSRYVYVSDAKVIESAKRYANKSEWQVANSKFYSYAVKKKALFAKCVAHMPKKRCADSYMPYKLATDADILTDALKYTTRKQWAEANPRMVRLALYNRGRAFYEKCCAHMPKRAGHKKPNLGTPVPTSA